MVVAAFSAADSASSLPAFRAAAAIWLLMVAFATDVPALVAAVAAVEPPPVATARPMLAATSRGARTWLATLSAQAEVVLAHPAPQLTGNCAGHWPQQTNEAPS